jgi:hypothetical protein
MYKIDNFNRELIIERYVDDIVGRLHFLEVKEHLKDCLLQQKYSLNNEDLEIEIMRHDPGLMTDIYLEETLEEVSHA